MFFIKEYKRRVGRFFHQFAVCIMASNFRDRATRSGKSFADNDVPESSRKGKGGPRKKDHEVKTRSHTSQHGDLKIGKYKWIYGFIVH